MEISFSKGEMSVNFMKVLVKPIQKFISKHIVHVRKELLKVWRKTEVCSTKLWHYCCGVP